MSIFFLKDPDCLFIHIPKTAGTSIRHGVWFGNYEGPIFGNVPDEWKHHFSFAFIRHPLDRLLSAYFMFNEGTSDSTFKLPEDAHYIGVEEFVKIVVDESIAYDQSRKTFEEKIRHHTIPQTHPFNCLENAGFIGKYENIDRDFEKICAVLHIDAKLPKMHVTRNDAWQNYFKGDSLDIIIEYYKDDFKLLGYSY